MKIELSLDDLIKLVDQETLCRYLVEHITEQNKDYAEEWKSEFFKEIKEEVKRQVDVTTNEYWGVEKDNIRKMIRIALEGLTKKELLLLLAKEDSGLPF